MVEPAQITPTETAAATPAAPVYLTKSEAVERVAESESTVKKYLREGRFPNANKDDTGQWRIPASDLAGAGLTLVQPGTRPPQETPMEPPANPLSNPLMTLHASEIWELRERVIRAEAERDALRREVAAQARALELAEGVIRRAIEAAPQMSAHSPAVIDLGREQLSAKKRWWQRSPADPSNRDWRR